MKNKRNTMFKYTVEIYSCKEGEERTFKGILFAKSYPKAVKKICETYGFEDPTGEYNVDICSVEVEQLEEIDGTPTEVYEFQESGE
ncbi:MAG: hypothetical protein J6T10_03445 [Methanobrevibacter sp.]|nr:hypothetical protein [Methanobrevibacter sp.]